MAAWVGERAILESRYGNDYGRILYGVRMPIVSQLNPLAECPHGSKKKIQGETPNYYFVSDKHEGLKTRLSIWFVNNEKILAIGRGAGRVFFGTVRRDDNSDLY